MKYWHVLLLILVPAAFTMAIVGAERFTARRVFLSRGPVRVDHPWLMLSLFVLLLGWQVVMTFVPLVIVILILQFRF